MASPLLLLRSVLLETGMSSLDQAGARRLCTESQTEVTETAEEGESKVLGAENHGLSEVEKPSR